MAALLNFWSSPSKQNKESVNGTAPTPRGTKRKAKRDPYDDMDDDDDVIPARKTPTSQRTARSRLSSASATPASTSKPRTPLTAKRRPGRPSLKSQLGDTPDTAATSRAATGPSPARAKATDATAAATAASSDSLVPEAPMGGLELLGNNAANAPASSAPKPEAETVQEPPVQETGRGRGRGKGKEKLTETVSAPDGQVPAPEQKEEEEEDTREEVEIERLLKHRMAGDMSGAVELLVQWEGEGEQDATWEAEEEIQENAAETLYEYWKAQGGRISALFHKPKNAPPETYHVFKVLRHERKNRGGFQFEVQWVGHPATHGETTMEAETKLKNIAPEKLQEYWESVGGRAKYLAARGRAAKKSRVE